MTLSKHNGLWERGVEGLCRAHGGICEGGVRWLNLRQKGKENDDLGSVRKVS